MIKDLAELQKLLKLCRKQGVTEITLGSVSLKLGDLPTRKAGAEKDDEEEEDGGFDSLTPEQQIFMSARGDAP